MESEVSSKAPAGPSRNQGLSTVYVPLNHKHHEQANVLYAIVGNPRDSLPPVDSRQYLDFFHRMMKARPLCPSRLTHLASSVPHSAAPAWSWHLSMIRAVVCRRTPSRICPGAERALLHVTCRCSGRCGDAPAWVRCRPWILSWHSTPSPRSRAPWTGC